MDNGLVRANGVGPTGRNTGGRPTAPEKTGKHNKMKRIVITVGIVMLLVIVSLGGWFAYRSSTSAVIDGSKFQAVFFTNGQVYFGKLQTLNGNYMKLTNIFYLQAQTAAATDASKNPQQTAAQATSDVKLIKLGSEVHGPNDEMVISTSQILFFENLKNDGKVAQSITTYQQSQK